MRGKRKTKAERQMLSIEILIKKLEKNDRDWLYRYGAYRDIETYSGVHDGRSYLKELNTTIAELIAEVAGQYGKGGSRYPMSDDQHAQIDCRNEGCQFYQGAGLCGNVSPAITLNPDKTFVCWTKNME